MLKTQIIRFPSLPSTNLEASRQAIEGASEGLCIVADEQTAGRGRMERQWISPPGAGLYFSIVLRPTLEQTSWPLLTLMAAVAVHDALLESCDLVTDIKWPNDILADEKKLCGILAETVDTRIGRAVVLGIGVNLNHSSFPAELASTATSVEVVTGASPDRQRVIEVLTRLLAVGYQEMQTSRGPATIIREWSSRSTYAKGKRVRVTGVDESVEGVTRGLAGDGGLLIETDDGEIKTIRAGDVTSVRPAVALDVDR